MKLFRNVIKDKTKCYLQADRLDLSFDGKCEQTAVIRLLLTIHSTARAAHRKFNRTHSASYMLFFHFGGISCGELTSLHPALSGVGERTFPSARCREELMVYLQEPGHDFHKETLMWGFCLFELHK